MTPRKTLSWDPGGTAPGMKQPDTRWQGIPGACTVQLPPGRHGHRVSCGFWPSHFWSSLTVERLKHRSQYDYEDTVCTRIAYDSTSHRHRQCRPPGGLAVNRTWCHLCLSSVSLAAVLMSKPVQLTMSSVRLLLCLPLDLLPLTYPCTMSFSKQLGFLMTCPYSIWFLSL